MKDSIKITFISLSPTGLGLSGGDRIFIELSRNWSKICDVNIYTTEEGIEMCKRQNLSGQFLHINKVENSKLPGNFLIKYIYKICLGIKLGLSFQYSASDIKHSYLYSSSDFWMDVFPAVIIKIRYPKLKWVASWYQTAPNPFLGYIEQATINKEQRVSKYKFSALLYKLSQVFVKPLVKRYADFVIVNNEGERKQFNKMDNKGKVKVILGAIRLEEIKRYLANHRSQSASGRYDAVYQGRFHPQKGVIELIEIWKKVVVKKPDAILAMIGDGPLMTKVRLQITNYKLQNNVKLFGFVFDGPGKYRIFSQSKIVVHPAFYDSGGMAAAEAMAFGIPCIGFNLDSYKSYYPEGMLKVEKGNLKLFADKIVELLNNDNLRTIVGKKAQDTIYKNWSWENRAQKLYSSLFG